MKTINESVRTHVQNISHGKMSVIIIVFMTVKWSERNIKMNFVSYGIMLLGVDCIINM